MATSSPRYVGVASSLMTNLGKGINEYQNLRSFSGKSESKFVPLLEKEIKFETKLQAEALADKDSQTIKYEKEIKTQYTFHEQTGSSIVKLVKSTGSEKIEVIFDCQDMEEVDEEYTDDMDDEELKMKDEPDMESDDEESGGRLALKFHVSITKGDSKLVFSCSTSEGLKIQNIKHLPVDKEITDATLYSGPIFDELEPDLQHAFYEFLDDRKIDENFADFLFTYAEEKENAEYFTFLKNTLKFVK